MKFSEIATRLTGFSTPVFGVSWQPPKSDVAVAKAVIAYLEDRRALYNPYHAEITEHVVLSLIDTRRELTQILKEDGISSELAIHVRAIRSLCREFIDSQQQREMTRYTRSGFDDYLFNQNLGQLRARMGYHVAAICASYGVDIEGDLATILPQSIIETD